jgi:hypothetical protein
MYWWSCSSGSIRPVNPAAESYPTIYLISQERDVKGGGGKPGI